MLEYLLDEGRWKRCRKNIWKFLVVFGRRHMVTIFLRKRSAGPDDAEPVSLDADAHSETGQAAARKERVFSDLLPALHGPLGQYWRVALRHHLSPVHGFQSSDRYR